MQEQTELDDSNYPGQLDSPTKKLLRDRINGDESGRWAKCARAGVESRKTGKYGVIIAGAKIVLRKGTSDNFDGLKISEIYPDLEAEAAEPNCPSGLW